MTTRKKKSTKSERSNIDVREALPINDTAPPYSRCLWGSRHWRRGENRGGSTSHLAIQSHDPRLPSGRVIAIGPPKTERRCDERAKTYRYLLCAHTYLCIENWESREYDCERSKAKANRYMCDRNEHRSRGDRSDRDRTMPVIIVKNRLEKNVIKNHTFSF